MTEKTLTASDLPMTFQAKYLGCCKAAGLWGIKHTRKPVDLLVDAAKTNRQVLPVVEIKVTTEALQIQDVINQYQSARKNLVTYPIDSISYGVQDLTFTRVFCMIVCNQKVLEEKTAKSSVHDMTEHPFMCHAFACESRHQARQLTFALSAAFKHFADVMKSANDQDKDKISRVIDLRTAEQIADEDSETEA